MPANRQSSGFFCSTAPSARRTPRFLTGFTKSTGNAEELQIRFPVIFDPEGKIAEQYNVKVQPLALVLSPEHKLLAALLGGVGEAELDELLARYLQ
jgi:hypothetical protein